MSNDKFTFEKLSEKIKNLIGKGWIKYSRNNASSHDGLLGNILEDLLGVKENNLRLPDFGKWEIKTKKSKSRITLFCSTLSSPKGASATIREKYGALDQKTNKKYFNPSLYIGRWAETTDKYKFTYMLKLIDKKLVLFFKNKETGKLINEEYYWELDEIKRVAERKINNICYVPGQINKEEKKVLFNSAEIYSDFMFDKLIELFNQHKVVVEFRIGVYNSGKHKGKTHDHGCAFRINEECLAEIYNKHKKI